MLKKLAGILNLAVRILTFPSDNSKKKPKRWGGVCGRERASVGAQQCRPPTRAGPRRPRPPPPPRPSPVPMRQDGDISAREEMTQNPALPPKKVFLQDEDGGNLAGD